MSDVNQDPSSESDERFSQNDQGEHVKFLGWQKTRTGELYPLYNIMVKGHPNFGSTVSDKTLQKLNLAIPRTPPPQADLKNP
ncbi:MAG: hypothetical protein H6Q30_1053 [Bacteroidetes bacterium]|nr:hypothetical protein [Bacteroidota bacterium]